LTNDIWSHYLPCQVNNHHIGNEDLVLFELCKDQIVMKFLM
jgi:hypothetical protein